jgi:hypothetical protein
MKPTLKDQSGIDITYLVMDGETVLGKITKGRGSKYPWRAYAHVEQHGIVMQPKLLGSYYPEDGGKQAAFDAVVKAKTPDNGV